MIVLMKVITRITQIIGFLTEIFFRTVFFMTVMNNKTQCTKHQENFCLFDILMWMYIYITINRKCLYLFLISANLWKKSSIDEVLINFEKYLLVISILLANIFCLEKLILFEKFWCFFRKKWSTKMNPNFELVNIFFRFLLHFITT